MIYDPVSLRHHEQLQDIDKLSRLEKVREWYVEFTSNKIPKWDKPIQPNSRNVDPFLKRRLWNR